MIQGRDFVIIGGLLLGGKSVRMGQPKGLAHLPEGRPMALPCLRALSAVAQDVALLGGPLDLEEGFGLRVLRDLTQNLGPLGGVEAALKSGLGDGWIILPWDMPQVGPGDLQPLVSALGGGATLAVFRSDDAPGGLAPFPLGIASGVLPELEAHLRSGGRSVWRFLRGRSPLALAPPPGDPARFRGINTPEALGACPRAWDTDL